MNQDSIMFVLAVITFGTVCLAFFILLGDQLILNLLEIKPTPVSNSVRVSTFETPG